MKNYMLDNNLINILDRFYDELNGVEVLEVSRYFLDKILNNSSWWDFDTREDYEYFNYLMKKIINEIKKVEEM